MFNNKQNLAKNMDATLKPSHLKGITHITHFYTQKAKCARHYLEINPEICTRVQNAHPVA